MFIDSVNLLVLSLDGNVENSIINMVDFIVNNLFSNSIDVVVIFGVVIFVESMFILIIDSIIIFNVNDMVFGFVEDIVISSIMVVLG